MAARKSHMLVTPYLRDLDDVLRLQPLGPFDDVERHAVTLIQRFEALGDDAGVVHEDVRSMLPNDESIALGFVVPLHGSLLRHRTPLRRRDAAYIGTVDLPGCLRQRGEPNGLTTNHSRHYFYASSSCLMPVTTSL